MENQGSTGERNHHTATPDHGDNGDHGIWQAQRVEVGKVGRSQKERDAGNGPSPLERRALMPLRIPQQQEDGTHEAHLIDIVPRLHQHGWELLHEVFVVQTADGPEHGSHDQHENPSIMLEVDALTTPCPTEQEEGDDGQRDTYPLVEVEPLSEDEQGSHQHHHRTGGIDGAYDGEGQMLSGKIAEYPRGQHDARLEQDEAMHLPPCLGHEEDAALQCLWHEAGDEDEWAKEQTQEQGVEEQHREHGIVLERLFAKGIIHTQQHGR